MIFFSLLFIIHGLLHLSGCARAFQINSFFGKNSAKITKTNGLLWGVAAILFVITGSMFRTSAEYWWIFSMISISISQYLIIADWKEAKSGTTVNFVLLALTLLILFNIY